MTEPSQEYCSEDPEGHRRVRLGSWNYEEDHYIQQYFADNDLLPINEYDCEYDDQYEYEYEREREEGDDLNACGDGGNRVLSCDTMNDDPRNSQEEEPAARSPFRVERRRRTVLGKAWDIPSAAAMQRRGRFRQLVHDETQRHRRIIARDTPTEDGGNHNSNNNNNNNNHPRIQPPAISEIPAANISQLLWDREIFGGGNGRKSGMRNRSRRPPNSNTARYPGFSTTRRISSFDFEFDDDETTMEYWTEEEDSSGNKRRRRRRRRRKGEKRCTSPSPKSTTSSSPTTVTATETSDANVGTMSPPVQTNGPLYRRRCSNNSSSSSSSICHRPTTDQLRTYAEQVCVTKFEASYLTHLTEEDQEEETTSDNANDDENNINRSKAVSTISIAFSPDGKTMASTHGDHTVKITCCLTGRLLQTLVGHPRTPWTVKYHPHAREDQHSASDNPYTNTPVTIIADGNSSTNTSNNVPGRRQDPSSRESSHREQQQPSNHSGAAIPQKQQILASGCLGHQVRIWDWVSGTCLQMMRLEYAIISLSFHPSGSLLAIANGTKLHFWGLPTVSMPQEEESTINGNANGNANRGDPTRGTTLIPNRGNGGRGGNITQNNNNNNNNNRGSSQNRQGTSTSVEMRHMLRCVHFLPDGNRVIVGGVNPQSRNDAVRQRRAQETGTRYAPQMSFYLRLWDFDLYAAKGLMPPDAGATEVARAAAGVPARRRRPINNSRLFVPRALLYNDGGFDVSPDGKTLCACAEYWLPDGVDNATDLLHPPQNGDFEDDDVSECYSETCSEEGNERQSGENDVEMNDGTSHVSEGNETSREDNVFVEEGRINLVVMAADSVGTNDTTAASNVRGEESTDEHVGDSSARQHTSPTRPASSLSLFPSATPPRIAVRQQQRISSPPPTFGTTAGTIPNASTTVGLPTTPIQAVRTPQTPPPPVNPLHSLDPPPPPGRRFAGGLGSTGSRSAQALHQHEQLRQQHVYYHHYGQQQPQLMGRGLEQHQHAILATQQPQQQQQQQQRTGRSSGRGNAEVTIPAPPGINHRNPRQHRLYAPHASGTWGNPFVATTHSNMSKQKGRYVPHVVTISLDTEPYIETVTRQVFDTSTVGSATAGTNQGEYMRVIPGAANISATTVTSRAYKIPGKTGDQFVATNPHMKDRRPRLGQLLSACPLDGSKASAVTCVKFSPCTEFCLIGYGVREPHVERGAEDSIVDPTHPLYHPVTAMYKVNTGGRMRHVSTMLSGDDDVNIARFHPESGHGFVYGTKQGRIRVLSPRPWNYYNC